MADKMTFNTPDGQTIARETMIACLNTGTKEEIQAYTRKLIRENDQPGIMLGADCTLPATIDPERIQWVIDAANEA